MRCAGRRQDVAIFSKPDQHRADGWIGIPKSDCQLVLGHCAATLQDRQEENSAYGFLSDRAQGAVKKYGVKSISLLAHKT